MIQDIASKIYDNHYAEQLPELEDWLLIYHKGDVLCRFVDGRIFYPKVEEICQGKGDMVYLFSISGERFFLLKEELNEIPDGYTWKNSGVFRDAAPRYLGFAGITGQQLDDWYRLNRFCGRCGKPMVLDHIERMIRCEDCGNMVYPRINPGVIVAVTDGNRL